jgi:iron(II)-dependent oxidoreductase
MLLWGCGKESAGPGENEEPLADAGENREAWAYTEVVLDGGLSSDPDDDRLRYLWSQDPNNPEEVILAYRPEWGEREEFISQRIFTTSRAGTYRFMLVVDDGRSSSLPDTVTVVVEGSVRPPRGMVYVPAGEFVMGYDGSKFDGDRPAHRVYLDAFFIDKYEVTQKDFREFMDVVGGVKSSIYGGVYGGDVQPVWAVSWDDARRYAEWKGKRLPTDAEWEKAARGTDERVFPWGNELVHTENGDITYYANIRGNADGYTYTAPVGSFPQGASPYGVMDMVGNMAEWVADWFEEDYYKNSPYENPKGPESGTLKVIRGGNFYQVVEEEEYFKSYHRTGVPPADLVIVRTNRLGFRCAMDVE